MLNVQKTSSLFKPELNREKAKFVSPGGSGHGRMAKCNICKTTFKARSRYELFCDQCRTMSDTYRFAEWLAA
jgi:hypothetical protein